MEREREVRYVMDRQHAARVFRLVRRRLRLELHDVHRPIGYTRTIYLDTADARYLASYRSSTAVRLRLRQYAAAADERDVPLVTSQVHLELKRSSGGERDKVRIPLGVASATSLLIGRLAPDTVEAMTRAGLADVVEQLRAGELAPRVMTWYRRVALVAEDIRVTFDEAIAYARPEPPREPGAPAEPERVLARDPRAVLECKLRRRPPRFLARALAGLEPDTEHSKYRAGMAAVALSAVEGSPVTLPLPVLV